VRRLCRARGGARLACRHFQKPNGCRSTTRPAGVTLASLLHCSSNVAMPIDATCARSGQKQFRERLAPSAHLAAGRPSASYAPGSAHAAAAPRSAPGSARTARCAAAAASRGPPAAPAARPRSGCRRGAGGAAQARPRTTAACPPGRRRPPPARRAPPAAQRARTRAAERTTTHAALCHGRLLLSTRPCVTSFRACTRRRPARPHAATVHAPGRSLTPSFLRAMHPG